MRNRIIAVDFDGTLCESNWPGIGHPNKGLINYLKACKDVGDKIILWSCREGDALKQAVEWCAMQGLTFDAVNTNAPEVIEAFGGDSRKVFADVYIDDRMCNLFTLPYVNRAQ